MNTQAIRYACALFLLLALGAPSQGAPKSKTEHFKLRGKAVQIQLPTGWQAAEGYAGIQLVILAPMSASQKVRPAAIAVSNIGIDQDLDGEDLATTQAEYRKGREAWLKKKDGQSLAYFPYETKSWEHVSPVHTIGFEYILDGRHVVERTYYFKCSGVMFNIKTMVSSETRNIFEPVVDEILRGFNCK